MFSLPPFFITFVTDLTVSSSYFNTF